MLNIDVTGVERSKVVFISLLLRRRKENVVNMKNQSPGAGEINSKEGEDKLCSFGKEILWEEKLDLWGHGMGNLGSGKEKIYKWIMLYVTVSLQLDVEKEHLESVGKFTFQIHSSRNRLMGINVVV